MNPKEMLSISLIVLVVIMTFLILIQKGGKGLGSLFGGGDEEIEIKRRGPEKIIFVITIIISSLFVLNAIAIMILNAKG